MNDCEHAPHSHEWKYSLVTDNSKRVEGITRICIGCHIHEECRHEDTMYFSELSPHDRRLEKIFKMMEEENELA